MDITLFQSGSSVLSVAGCSIPATRCHLLLAAACHCSQTELENLRLLSGSSWNGEVQCCAGFPQMH